MDWSLIVFGGIFVAFAVMLYRARGNARSRGAKQSARGKGNRARFRAEEIQADVRKRDEALFVSMFPDLQPYYHPEALVQFVRAHLARNRASASWQPFQWKRPPGFGIPLLEVAPGTERVRHTLRDDAGAVLSTFDLDDHPEGAVLRVGKGKFTVNVKEAVPRVRYWHPQREFKWSEKKGWVFVTPMAERPIESDDTGTSFSRDSSTTSNIATGAAIGAGIAAAGGAFDGGGASASWDGGPGAASDSADSASGGADFSSVESGSSSTSSTAY